MRQARGAHRRRSRNSPSARDVYRPDRRRHVGRQVAAHGLRLALAAGAFVAVERVGGDEGEHGIGFAQLGDTVAALALGADMAFVEAPQSLEEIARAARGITALVGTPHFDRDLYNACAVCSAGVSPCTRR